MLADLPPALCKDSKTPTLCQSVVTEGLLTLTAAMRRFNGTELCEEIGLCPRIYTV